MSISRVTARPAAKLIGVSRTTVERLWHDGLLEGEIVNTAGYLVLWLSLDSVHAEAARRARLTRSRQALKDGRLDAVEFEDGDLLTSGEAAILVGTQRQNICNWIARGKFRDFETTRHGNYRIRFDDVHKLIKLKRSK